MVILSFILLSAILDAIDRSIRGWYNVMPAVCCQGVPNCIALFSSVGTSLKSPMGIICYGLVA
jgi:hypothetical protein